MTEERKFDAKMAGFHTAETKKEITFANHIHFPAVDNNFDILKPQDRQLTNEDIEERGMYSTQEKVTMSLTKLLKGLTTQLSAVDADIPAERKKTVENLKARRPTFIELEKNEIDQNFVQAVKLFSSEHPGVILLPETESIINQISAFQHSDGRFARLMKGKVKENAEEFVQSANYLTPQLEYKAINESEAAYAVDFMNGAERPKKISQEELDDWLERVKTSGLIFGFDVGLDDPSLDNFVRKDGKLFWVDGNILHARPAKDQEELNSFVNQQKEILHRYIEQK